MTEMNPTPEPEPGVVSGSHEFHQNPNGQLTIITSVYHQYSGQNPEASDYRVCRMLESDEQVWTRRMKVNAIGWRPLDLGWYHSQPAGMVVLVQDKTLAGKPPTRVIVGLAPGAANLPPNSEAYPLAYLLPGDPLRIVPALDLSKLVVRSESGEVLVTLKIYPR